MRAISVWVKLSVFVFVSGFAALPAAAQLTSEVVVTGLSAPVAIVQDPTQSNVQVIVEQGGRIRVVRNGQLQPVDFIDLTPLVLSGGERGLLGLAFAPDYATTGRFFVNYTRQPDGHTVISRYRRSASDPLRGDASSRFDLLWPTGNRFITQPFANHNGGDVEFGSDGYLYIPLGDGGSGNDPFHNAQNPAELLGKILRIDVRVPDSDLEGYNVPLDNPFVGQPGVFSEIWAFGVRNPFRLTVDAIERGGTGALVFGDVGQDAWEEIDYEPFGARGRNYGWRNREGAHDNVTTLPPAFGPLVDPIVEYSHGIGNVVTGGVVYRGSGLGIGFFGRYFFADFGARRIWSVGLDVSPATREAHAGEIIEHTTELGGGSVIGNVSSFGLGADCEVYFLNYGAGQLRRIAKAGGGAPAGCPTSPDPFLGLGGGVFTDGQWFTRDNPRAAGAGLGGSSGSSGAGANSGACITAQPVSDWVCVNGGWVPPDHPLARGPAGVGGTGGSGGSTGSGAGAPGSSGCLTVQPASDWICLNGGWLPPGSPLAGTPAPGGGTGGSSGGIITPPPPPPTTTSCASTRPASDWVCVNGGWLPPNHPLAGTAGGTGGTGGGATGGTPVTDPSCTTIRPAPDWVCVSGGWLPPSHPLVRGGGLP